jgi:hypothetical protein
MMPLMCEKFPKTARAIGMTGEFGQVSRITRPSGLVPSKKQVQRAKETRDKPVLAVL